MEARTSFLISGGSVVISRAASGVKRALAFFNDQRPRHTLPIFLCALGARMSVAISSSSHHLKCPVSPTNPWYFSMLRITAAGTPFFVTSTASSKFSSRRIIFERSPFTLLIGIYVDMSFIGRSRFRFKVRTGLPSPFFARRCLRPIFRFRRRIFSFFAPNGG